MQERTKASNRNKIEVVGECNSLPSSFQWKNGTWMLKYDFSNGLETSDLNMMLKTMEVNGNSKERDH